MRHPGPAARAGIALLLLVLAGAGVPGGVAGAGEVTLRLLWPAWTAQPGNDLLAQFRRETGIATELRPLDHQGIARIEAEPDPPVTLEADVIRLAFRRPPTWVADGRILLRPLDDLVAGTDLSDLVRVETWRTEAGLLALPVDDQPILLEVNGRRLAAAGVTEDPKTWAELVETARALRDRGVDPHPIAIAPGEWSWELIARSMGDPFIGPEGEPLFAATGSPARQALVTLLAMAAEELIDPAIVARERSPHATFWDGGGTIHMGWLGSLAVANGSYSRQAPDVRPLPIPETGATFSVPGAIGITAESTVPAEAWRFLTWVVSEVPQRALWERTGLFPARSSVAAALGAEGAIEGWAAIAPQLPHVQARPILLPWWDAFETEADALIVAAAQDGTPADAVVDALGLRWAELRATAGG